MFKTHRLEDTLERFIGNPILQWYIHGVSPSFASPLILLCSGTREVLPEFVKTAGHDSIGGVEGFFDAVTMVAVNIDVQDARVRSEELEDTEDDIIDVAKA